LSGCGLRQAQLAQPILKSDIRGVRAWAPGNDTIAMTEPGAGSDLQAIRTRAERSGNQYAINGSKTFISNGYLAGLVVVVCKTDPAERARGISLMLVETKDCAGFRVMSLA
jgi:alkylation response protein AidB-like acyl-CoA dehydrogenase